MKISQSEPALVINGEDGDRLAIVRDNRGEPYREGLSLDVSTGDYERVTHIFFDTEEAVRLRDFINRMVPWDDPILTDDQIRKLLTSKDVATARAHLRTMLGITS